MSHVTTECSSCGNKFSYDDGAFSTRPEKGGKWDFLTGYGYLCSNCASDQNEQKRHDERIQGQQKREEREEERHQERMRAMNKVENTYTSTDFSNYGNKRSTDRGISTGHHSCPDSTVVKSTAKEPSPVYQVSKVIIVGIIIPVAIWGSLAALTFIVSFGVVVAGVVIAIGCTVAGMSGGLFGMIAGGLIGWLIGFKMLPDIATAVNLRIDTWQSILLENMPQLVMWFALAAAVVGILKYGGRGAAGGDQQRSVASRATVEVKQTTRTTWIALAVIASIGLVGWNYGGQMLDRQGSSSTSVPTLQASIVSRQLSPVNAAEPQAVVSAIQSLVTTVITENRASIQSVVAIAESSENAQIESAARDAGRLYSIPNSYSRNRKRARPLNEEAIRALNSRGDPQEAYRLGQQAFAADPIDPEIAGNLAIFALRAGHSSESNDMAIYALSLPRAQDRTGRTADWATLAASYAELGEMQKARNSLFVTIAIAPDFAKRCYSAVYSVKNTYTAALRVPTEAMFRRIRDQGLTSAQECALPILW